MTDKRKEIHRAQTVATLRYVASFLDRLTVALWATAGIAPMLEVLQAGATPPWLTWVALGAGAAGTLALSCGILLVRLAAKKERS